MAKKNVNSLQVSDIVSVKTMVDIAKIVRTKAASIAKKNRAALAPKRETSNIYNPNLIGIKTPQTTKNQILIDLTLSPVGMAFEYGSGKHAGGGTYPIEPKNKKVLAFYWDKAYPEIPRLPDGRVMLSHVDHPGVAAKPFLEPAKRATAQERRELLEKEVGKNIRTIISGMARVVKCT